MKHNIETSSQELTLGDVRKALVFAKLFWEDNKKIKEYSKDDLANAFIEMRVYYENMKRQKENLIIELNKLKTEIVNSNYWELIKIKKRLKEKWLDES